jgi:hypothetical protein
MSLSIQKMHDATLLAIHFDWMSRTCTFDFAGAPTLLEPFAISFFDVTELVVPAKQEWGSSNSVLEVLDQGTGCHDFIMQSGDIIRVVASNHSGLSPLSQHGKSGV